MRKATSYSDHAGSPSQGLLSVPIEDLVKQVEQDIEERTNEIKLTLRSRLPGARASAKCLCRCVQAKDIFRSNQR